MPKRTTPETKLLRESWDYLHRKGHFVLRINNVAPYDVVRKIYKVNRYMTKGVADLMVVPKDRNDVVFIELKSPKGRLSADQILFQKHCDDHAIEYEVVRSLDELIGLGL